MRSALQFLQDMDSYYGQIARPSSNKRFQRRSSGSSEECPEDEECEPGLSRFMLLQASDDSIARLSRPRFGKRSEGSVPTDPRFILLQGSDDSIARLSRPRFGKRSEGALMAIPNPPEMYIYGGPGGGPAFYKPR